MQVRPEYHRRGLGGRLLRRGLDDADKAGAQTLLAASDPGMGLYVKEGFETLVEFTFDYPQFGMSRARNSRVMRREPKPLREQERNEEG